MIFCREHHRAEDKAPFPIKDDRLHNVMGDEDLVLCKKLVDALKA